MFNWYFILQKTDMHLWIHNGKINLVINRLYIYENINNKKKIKNQTTKKYNNKEKQNKSITLLIYQILLNNHISLDVMYITNKIKRQKVTSK